MNKLTGVLLIFTIFPAHVSANSCDIEGYTIGFFNGVATTLKGAKQGQKKIESTLGIKQFNGEPVEYQLFYNDSYIESNGLNVLADFAETFDQRTQELGQKQFDRWEAFWEIVSGRQDSSIIQKISATFSWFKGFVSDLLSQGMNTMIREFLLLLSTSIDSPDTEKTQMQHKLINDSNTWKGKKLIYIAHSQGNLWVNQSYKYVVSQLGYDADNIHVVHIAPASPTLTPDSDYILSTSGLVINGLQLTGIGSVPVPNTAIAPSTADIAGHGLIEIYLTHPDSINKIKKSVGRAFDSLTKPDMEEHLFEVTYQYTPSFVESHAEPEIKFVDNPSGDWFEKAMYPHYDDSYFEYDSAAYKYKLKPVAGLKYLSHQRDKKDRENQTFTVVQCSNIPNDDPFILGEKSEALIWYGYDEQPDNTKVIVTVRDRYGRKLQSGEQSVSELRRKGWRYQGIFLDLKAKNPYSQKEKSFIEKQNLETRYELHSNSILLPTAS
ncbi:hypothetical protein CIF45_RS06720 [Vibrio parahaemolyticus]|nr:hypothetical protein [Vibrio parahaemolyticus]